MMIPVTACEKTVMLSMERGVTCCDVDQASVRNMETLKHVLSADECHRPVRRKGTRTGRTTAPRAFCHCDLGAGGAAGGGCSLGAFNGGRAGDTAIMPNARMAFMARGNGAVPKAAPGPALASRVSCFATPTGARPECPAVRWWGCVGAAVPATREPQHTTSC